MQLRSHASDLPPLHSRTSARAISWQLCATSIILNSQLLASEYKGCDRGTSVLGVTWPEATASSLACILLLNSWTSGIDDSEENTGFRHH